MIFWKGVAIMIMLRFIIHVKNYVRQGIGFPGQGNVQRIEKSRARKECLNIFHEDSIMEQIEDSLTS